MRIIAGRLGGRQFEAPGGQRTHPMSDRVRGGLFNSLGDITDLSVLDAFAGSGALSFEALSRGAAHAIAIDIDKKAHSAVQKNAVSLYLAAQLHAVRANVGGWSANNPDAVFDIVLADPPYDALKLESLAGLTRHVAAGGLFVLSWPGREPAPGFDHLKPVATNNYGDAQLIFYRKA